MADEAIVRIILEGDDGGEVPTSAIAPQARTQAPRPVTPQIPRSIIPAELPAELRRFQEAMKQLRAVTERERRRAAPEVLPPPLIDLTKEFERYRAQIARLNAALDPHVIEQRVLREEELARKGREVADAMEEFRRSLDLPVINLTAEFEDFRQKLAQIDASMDPAVLEQRIAQDLTLEQAERELAAAREAQLRVFVPLIDLNEEYEQHRKEIELLQAALDPEVVQRRVHAELELEQARRRLTEAEEAERRRMLGQARETQEGAGAKLHSFRGLLGGFLGGIGSFVMDIIGAVQSIPEEEIITPQVDIPPLGPPAPRTMPIVTKPEPEPLAPLPMPPQTGKQFSTLPGMKPEDVLVNFGYGPPEAAGPVIPPGFARSAVTGNVERMLALPKPPLIPAYHPPGEIERGRLAAELQEAQQRIAQAEQEGPEAVNLALEQLDVAKKALEEFTPTQRAPTTMIGKSRATMIGSAAETIVPQLLSPPGKPAEIATPEAPLPVTIEDVAPAIEPILGSAETRIPAEEHEAFAAAIKAQEKAFQEQPTNVDLQAPAKSLVEAMTAEVLPPKGPPMKPIIMGGEGGGPPKGPLEELLAPLKTATAKFTAGVLTFAVLIAKASLDWAAAVNDAAVAPGQLTGTLLSREHSLASSIGGVARTFEAEGKRLGAAVPLIGGYIEKAFAQTAGFIDALASITQSLDGMVERYAMWSPELMRAQAEADITQMLGDIRRAQDVTPGLVQYLKNRTEIQQKFEEQKIRFLEILLPHIPQLMDLLEKFMPYLEEQFKGMVKYAEDFLYVQSILEKFFGRVEENTKQTAENTRKEPEYFEVPTDIIMSQRPTEEGAIADPFTQPRDVRGR